MSFTVSTIGFGIILSHSATAGGSYVPVAELLDITPPTSSVDEIKVYRSDNSAAIVEKIPGWLDYGDNDITITYTPAQRLALDALQGIPAFWKVTYPKVSPQTTLGDVEAFAGFIKSLGKETPLKGAMTMKVKVAVNGAVVLTPGT